jgi:hypothetical protein
MAPKKGGFILRGEVRRVECPVCHAGPGKLCTTFDKREHPERTTLAIDAQPDEPETKTAVPDQVGHAIDGTDGSGGGSPRERRETADAQKLEAATPVVTEAAENHPALNFTSPVPRDSSVPLGLNVFVDIQHGPTKFSWRGRLEDFDVRHRSLNLLGENGPQTIQWGENDMIVITDDR